MDGAAVRPAAARIPERVPRGVIGYVHGNDTSLGTISLRIEAGSVWVASRQIPVF